MSRHFNFGDDGDEPRLGISNHLPDVRLRVKTAVTPVRAVGRGGLRVQPEAGLVPPGADLGQAGILLDLNTPALIIREMQL